MRRVLSAVALALAAGASAPALAGQRPSDEELFGGEAQADAGAPARSERPSDEALFGGGGEADGGSAVPSPVRAEEAKAGEQTRDEAALFGPEAKSAFDTAEAKADPLQVGGTFYLRGNASLTDDPLPLSGATLSSPSLLDAYLDARPTERVRGMVLARMRYDPTYDPSESSSLAALFGAAGPARPNPSVNLDQLWIRFDLGRTVFVTAGKQHVKWGTSRFWTPTDFLTPERRDPLAVYDERLGASMLKVHVPWEAKGWNFYAIGLLDNAGPANRLGEVGGAARAEVVLGQTEVGADAVLVRGRRPRYGFDFSSAWGEFDVHAEVALRSGHDFRIPEVQVSPPGVPEGFLVRERVPEGPIAQVSGGLNRTINYTENDAVTVGVEYFYNPVGYDDPKVLPYLFYSGRYQPFYAGKHYAGAFALLVSPGSLDELTVTVSTLGNVSDLSFISRADVFLRVLTYLTVEAYGAVHYGNRGGEFRFGFDIDEPFVFAGQQVPELHQPAPLFDLGLGLRISL